MKGAPEYLTDRIVMEEQDGSECVFEEERDQFYVDIEPTTGVPMRIHYQFQVNFLLAKSSLYQISDDLMLPVMVVRGHMDGFSDSQFFNIFGLLVLGLGV